MSVKTIGFLGVGIMGRGMLLNLFRKSEVSTQFVIWNRNRDVAKKFAEEFGVERIFVAETAREVVERSEVTFSVLSNNEASVSVFDEPTNGAIAGVTEGKLIVDCATLAPERLIEISSAVRARGGRLLEAPVSGSKGPAETGQLIFLCGGDSEDMTAVSAELAMMGKASFHMGIVGQGSRAKLVVNMVMGGMLASFAEGLALAEASNINTKALLEIFDLGAMSNPMFRMKGPLMLSHQYSPNFPLKHAHKDMHLAVELGDSLGVSLPTSSAARDLYKSELEKLGDDDFSAVYEAVLAAAEARKALKNQ